MAKLELSKTGFLINNVNIQFPINISVLKQALGDYRYIKKQYSHIYTWDDLGIIAYSKKGNKIETLALKLKHGEYDYYPKKNFSGKFTFDGHELFQYYENNKSKLVKIFRGDKTGAFILNRKSVWFGKRNGKIATIEISVSEQEEKKEKNKAILDPEFKSFESLWQEWITEINKIVSTNNDYYNLTNGIFEEDIAEHTELDANIKIPAALINFYKVQNVNYDPVASVFQFGVSNGIYDLIPFEDIARVWNFIQSLQYDEEDLEDLPEQEIDFEKIQTNNYANPRWIPFATDHNGEYLLYDTDPAAKGIAGQIILLHRYGGRYIVADSLEELVRNEIKNLKEGKIEHFDFILGK